MTNDVGYSLWLDFVERDFLRNDFVELIERGVINGATSNPSIFANAISGSSAYGDQLSSLTDKSAKEKYEALAIEDIRTAAKALRPLYDRGDEGYISIEVDPFLADDAEATLAEARRLFKTIDEPNVMIKIPATDAGYPVIQKLLGDGISVNATLVFSPDQAKQCLKAMKAGIDEFDSTGGERIDAVISVFVSRFDRMLDSQLATKGLPTSLTGIMNAAKIYYTIESNRTPSIQTLYASTGVKGDELPTDYYVQKLCSPHAVNTAPLHTLEAAIENSIPDHSQLPSLDEIDDYFVSIEKEGIDMDNVYAKLLDDGLKAFEDSFGQMLKILE